MDKLVKVHNSILQSLSAVEMVMMKRHIKEMNDTFKPALKTLTWSSQRIPAFLAKANHAIDRFKSRRNEVRKHSISIENVVRHMERECLVVTDHLDGNPHRVTTLRNFAEMTVDRAKNKLNILCKSIG